MSIKKGIVVLITALGAEAAILWWFDRYTHLNLIQRINWKNVALWSCFGAGFLTAVWIWLWGQLLNKIFSFKKKSGFNQSVQQTVSVQKSQQNQVPPARMTVQNSAVLSVVPTTAQEGNNVAGVTADVMISPTQSSVPQKTKDIDALAELEPDLDMMAFKHVNLEGRNIDLVYSSDTQAMLCTILSEPHTWTVDTNAPIEESRWTDEAGNTIQPCLILLKQAAALEKMEPDSILYPTIVLMRGTIENAAEAIPYLKDHHITIATDQPSNMQDVQTVRDLLTLYFSPFPPSYDTIKQAADMGQTEELTELNQPEEEDNNG